MRVDPNFVQNLITPLEASSSAESQLTEELSSGVAFSNIGQSPVAASENTVLMNSISTDDSFVQTAGNEESMLQVSDSALSNVVTQLTSAISSAVQGNNGTMDAGDLGTLAQSLTGIRNEVLAMANSTYLGQYVFSGSQGTTQPFTLDDSTTPATVTYNGDSQTQTLTTPNGQSMQLNVPGDQIFTASGANVFSALNDLIARFASGESDSSTQADVSAIQTALTQVSQQRITIDNSLSQITTASTYAQTEVTQLDSAQNALIAADPAAVATGLSAAETQQSALESVIATLEKNDLFNYIQQ